ncbi:type IV toxin-antitoxin system AbiEi family antitoxin [Cyclobacterium sp. 1_MG-2023]|uniref:type IV toxin-antitoxin system AbiEi family antitoxin n=1 Tax=Cyclobacterium sp. 1_MG-2023 TaxID=3062681 RepID=UPI0026E3D43B|nr:type IV toxin-antitoxin system AbiEi family antitoxin [Cyclobacterium sp. 1_MG-2023]MDO6438766.1 type IV toxin-antitoxin system AbiEi family antitoxin [Cyclobacterium sp. 1_MG-2023]
MEREILNIALENVQKEVPFQFDYSPKGQFDGELTLFNNQQQYHFFIEVKKEVRQYIVAQLEAHKGMDSDVLLVAKRIPSKVKIALRERKMPYIEANGNVYIEKGHLFLLVDTHKPINHTNEKGNRAFTKTGLKVLFHFLLKPELVNKTQREIAEYTGVGLGNIPQVLDGLKATGYLLPLNKKEYTWQKRKELLFRWIEDYETILKPGLKKKTYQMRVDWKDIQLNEGIAAWGGEPGADLITHYLRPEKFILYTNEDQANLIRNYKLKPKKDGDLEVVEMFWNQNLNTQTAPSIIVYAELLIGGGKRNKETAAMIFNEQIKSII